MTSRAKNRLVLPLLLVLTATICLAQLDFGGGGGFRQRRGRGGGGGGGGFDFTEGNGVAVNPEINHTAREIASHSTSGTPDWTNSPAFSRDVFTFVRVVYQSGSARGGFGGGYGGGFGGRWITDFPDSDLNLSFRLQQMTSIKVNPDGRILRLTDPDLFHYPWIYMVEPGRLLFKDEEVAILRKYLLNGGFLMADDFWGSVQWENFHQQMKRVFPERDFVDLKMDHPIFHCVFDLKGPIEKLQVPGQRAFLSGLGFEYHDGEACTPIHVRSISDDRGRMMVIATHNTDNGDGWEREGEYPAEFFQLYSEKVSFPLGINIIYYAMTH